MPPKPKKAEPSKKTEIKKKEKIIEDKTFGLKNKKGAKQQKFIQHVNQQVTQMGKSAKQLEKEKLEKLAKKDDKKKTAEELNVLFKPVEQKVNKGVDPKSVLCAFFKAGQCQKGDKCKFSHDLSIGRKAEKRSVYADQRDDTMENWDEAKLLDVVALKHGESDNAKPKTDIICKYFLEAVESSKYGWFWTCPNGEACIYRHALPPGFVLKKDQKKDDKQEEISLEDLIERERAALSSKDLTKVTLQSFLKWKERKRKEKADLAMADAEKKKSNFAAGKMFGISGREMFEFNPELIKGDDEEAEEDVVYQREDNEDDIDEPVREVNLAMFAEEDQEFVELPSLTETLCNGTKSSGKDGDEEDDQKLGIAAALSNPDDDDDDEEENDDEADENNAPDGAANESFIDENLFDGEDLDLIEEELENLEVAD